jgi:pyruvate formate lyase activating enzyme
MDGMTDLGGAHPARYGEPTDDGRVRCTLCPRNCTMADGQRGFCFVRANQGGRLVLTTYGRSSGFCIDPIEKKPLNHFYPGTPVLSFGTAGCNLACKFCQNWDISKARALDRLQDTATPETIAEVAVDVGATSVAYTYNEPLIFAEYAIDTALECRARGVRNVAVSNGYCNDAVRRDFYGVMDAANIDLKGFTDEFYRSLTGGELQPVLDTLTYLVHETDVWLEITTLVIPGHNDTAAELKALATWVFTELGPDVPLHFSAFHPDYRMRDVPPTPHSTLSRARSIAREAGLRYVYVGNVHDVDGGSTFCPSCGAEVIRRDWYEILSYRLDAQGRCAACGTAIAGRFAAQAGHFGPQRLPVRLGS